ncbi:MAG TPA: L,D-transpeptidase family protein, partial [Alphaproteobacteria bacterium]|nr:L,D-transpeptidase family protein [Alphaproteobacteria bacterium]
QARHGFAADGSAGPHTLAALDVSRAARLTQIRANMERWRHMPEDFPPARYVMVNITDASVAVVEDGRPAYDGLAIVGRPDRKTPFIDSTIRSMIINPAWHVPANIARKDILPKLRKDPHYLEKLGFTIDDPDDPYGQHIDWKALKDQAFDFRLRQGPGKLNSLGRLKFDFTNDFAVYMHGTPHQALFAKERRMLSSGCVRLRDPEKVAAILLAGNEGDWDDAHIEAAIASGKTRWLAIADPIPVFFVYWTAFPDAEGNIQFRDDLYGYDDFLMDSLREEENPQHAAWHPQKIIAFP